VSKKIETPDRLIERIDSLRDMAEALVPAVYRRGKRGGDHAIQRGGVLCNLFQTRLRSCAHT